MLLRLLQYGVQTEKLEPVLQSAVRASTTFSLRQLKNNSGSLQMIARNRLSGQYEKRAFWTFKEGYELLTIFPR